MTNVVQLDKKKRSYREATAWMSKLDRGLSNAEEQALRIWMNENSDNANLFLEVVNVWDKMTTLSHLSDLFPEPKRRKPWEPGLAAAAAAVVVFSVGFWAYIGLQMPSDLPVNEVQSTDTVYETAIGEQSSVVLADGSRFVLNTNSQLRVRYTPHQRILSLVRGEVHVEVAGDASRPLSVVAGNNIVQAVGTAFDVKITSENSIQVVVTEGKVFIGLRPTPSNPLAEPSTPVLPPTSLTVSQGEEIELGSLDAKVESVSPEDIEVRLSWREGNLIFRGETLESAMDEIGRYTTVEFVFVHESLKHEVITGRFKAGDVEGLLAVLQENLGIVYERTNDGRILLSSL